MAESERVFASSNPGSPSVSLEALSRRHNRMYSQPLPSTRWLQNSPNCLQCGRNFGWWPWSRHHCRFCGQLVCSDCSRKRIIHNQSGSLLRICDRCFRDGCEQGAFLMIARDLGRMLWERHGDLEAQVRRSPGVLENFWRTPTSAGNEMDYCPGCSKAKPNQSHIQRCLERQSGKIIGNRMVLMPPEEPVPLEECPICYEALEHPVALLNCLCKYHQSCIDGWFDRNPSCPLHPAPTT